MGKDGSPQKVPTFGNSYFSLLFVFFIKQFRIFAKFFENFTYYNFYK